MSKFSAFRINSHFCYTMQQKIIRRDSNKFISVVKFADIIWNIQIKDFSFSSLTTEILTVYYISVVELNADLLYKLFVKNHRNLLQYIKWGVSFTDKRSKENESFQTNGCKFIYIIAIFIRLYVNDDCKVYVFSWY